MRKRLLGRTGVVVSEFALGTMTFGQEADERSAFRILDLYTESDGNLIDTADVYPPAGPRGASEEIIGRWLNQRPQIRDRIVLATKCRGRMDDSGNSEGLSRRWIVRACEDSLRRLNTDYIDLYQAHQWDPATPIEETLMAFDSLMQVKFEVKLRFIEIAECSVIGIACLFAPLPCRFVHLNCDGVFAAEIMEIRNVVVGLGDEDAHIVALTMTSGLDIDVQRAGELIEADVANGNVPECDGDVLGLTQALKLPIRAIV